MTENIIITEKEILDNPNNFELGQLVRTKLFKSSKFEKCPICGAEKKCTPEEENCKKDL
jgi:hypothetical protein